MMTAKEANEMTKNYIDEIFADEAPIFLKNICEEINNACGIGEYKCAVPYDAFHLFTVENVMIQLRKMGYGTDNIFSSKKILISWM